MVRDAVKKPLPKEAAKPGKFKLADGGGDKKAADKPAPEAAAPEATAGEGA
jgi:large subunit ribosomal protein L3